MPEDTIEWITAIVIVIFVVIVLVAQSIMFSYLMSCRPPPGRSPNNLAAIVAADVGSTLGECRLNFGMATLT